MSARKAWISIAFIAAVASPYFGILPGWTPTLATTVALTALALVGLNLIFGVTGMLAFGQAAFMVLPAYVAGVLERAGGAAVWSLPAGLVVGVVLARMLAGLFVRLPGVFLAFGTLGLGFVVEGLARAFPAWTGGASGLVLETGVVIPPAAWYAVAVAALTIGLIVFGRLRSGATWRRLRTIRHDELVAAVVGIDVQRRKRQVFTIGCAYACVAGTLLCYFIGVVVPEDAGAQRSLSQIGMVIMGGSGTLLGPLVGAFLVSWLFFAAGASADYQGLIYGAAFLLVTLYARDGLLGILGNQQARPPRPPEPAPLRTTRCQASCERSAADRGGYACLAVKDVGKSFQGLVALEGVSFEVAPGEIFALIGPNGAGKSTLFNVISGIVEPSAGHVELDGRDVTRLPIERRAAAIGRAFQVARLVPDLSAVENVMVRLDQIMSTTSEAERRAAALEQLDRFELLDRAHEAVAALGIGQHKLIDLARASVGDPSLVLLDEPAVGLTDSELEHLAGLIRRLSARNIAIVIVEHNIDFVATIAGRGLVLDGGRPVAIGPMDEILADTRVQSAYFGALT